MSNKDISKNDASVSTKGGLTRRSFLKTTGVIAAAGTVAGLSGCSLQDLEEGVKDTGEKTVVCNCRGNCHWACLHDVKVKDGVITSVTSHPFPDENYTSCCQRGIANAQRAYSPYRLKYPMRRVPGSERGADQWERITWDEAINEVAEKFAYYRDTFGGSSIVKDSMSGGMTTCNSSKGAPAKLSAAIGCSVSSSVDDRNSCAGTKRVMGVGPFGFTNEPKSVLDAKMIVVWGTNPCVTMPHLWRFMMLAQEAGTKVVCIDVLNSVTSYKADQFMRVTPASDLYMILAMCNYIIQNNLYDAEFLKARSNAPFLVGTDGKVFTMLEDASTRKEKDYYVYDPAQGQVVPFAEATDVALEGTYQFEGKTLTTAFTLVKNQFTSYTLSKAASMTGVDADTIAAFAEEFATIGPVTIHATYGLDHYNNGCMAFHALSVLLTLTGNFGRHGAGFTGIYCPSAPLAGGKITAVSKSQAQTSICSNMIPEVFETQKWKGANHPLKAMFSAGANPLSNQGDQNRWMKKTFAGLEYWVVADRAWTDSAHYADMILPIVDFYEVQDYRSGQNVPYVVLGDKAIEPPYEVKTDTEIFNAIGRKMGYTDDFPATFEGGEAEVKKVFDANAESKGWTYEKLQSTHVQRIKGGEDQPGCVQGLEDNPTFPTKSGRLELYWEDPAPRENYGQIITDEEVAKEHIPYWKEPTEAWKDNALFSKYPLVFLQLRSRFRTHTQCFEVPMFEEIEPEPYIRVSREDLEKRGINDGDYVEVFNDRGHCVVKAVLDDGYAPGVVCIPKGWQRHQFKAGCYQELTTAELDKWGVGGPMYDCLVDIKKWNE